MSEIDAIKRFIDPLKRRIMLSVARFVLKAVDDAKKMQRVQAQIFDEEVRDSVERFQQYGFTSNPHPGAEGVIIFPGGSRSHGVVIAIDDRRYRLMGLASGEVALFTDEGDYIKLKRGNQIEISTDKATFLKDVKIMGRLDVVGDIEGEADIIDKDGSIGGVRTVYNGHDHPGDSGGTTSTPNQLMPTT